MQRVGVDIGGTFTDLVAQDEKGQLRVTKVMTTPEDHAEGIMTAKASVIKEGAARIAGNYYIGGYSTGHPVMLPVVDIIEVGSGGGGIARLDAAVGATHWSAIRIWAGFGRNSFL